MMIAFSLLAAVASLPCVSQPSPQSTSSREVEVGDLSVQLEAYDRHSFVHYDVDREGTLWARGRGYKASASAAGFAFIPFLGSDAPRNYPVKMALASIARGGDGLPLREAPVTRREGDRIVLERGAVRVRYDLAPDGVEQSFELDAAPGVGDLVLVVDVDTELEVAESGRGFRFSNELGGVDYGGAVALDSTGARVDVPAFWSDGAIQLRVPASFLEQAAWPIVVDPLLTPFMISSSSAELRSPDATSMFDSSSNGWYSVVFEERFSAADGDVFNWYVGASGTAMAGIAFNGTYIDQTPADWRRPRISAQVNVFGSALVVAEADSLAVSGSADIVIRRRTSNGALNIPSVARSATPQFSCAAPDIGTDGAGDGSFMMVVAYNRVYPGYRDVYSFRPSNVTPLQELALAASPTQDCSAPSMSENSGNTGLALFHVVGWSERDLSTGATSVQAALVRFNNANSLGPFTIAGPTTSALYFDVDVSSTSSASVDPTGFENIYLVTYDDRLSSTTDALVAMCSGGSVLGTYELQLSEHADRAPNQNDVRVTTLGDQFLLGYEEDGELHMTILRPIGSELGITERRSVAVGSSLMRGSLAVAQGADFANNSFAGLFVWSEPGASSGNIVGAFAQIPSASDSAAGIQYCYGTANSTGDRGFIQVLGDRIVGGSLTLRVEALPPGVFGYYLASLMQGDVPGAGGSQGTLCVSGAVGRFGIYQSDASGAAMRPLDSAQIHQPLGAVAAMAGERWNFQSWHRDAVAGSSTSNFTNAVTVPFL